MTSNGFFVIERLGLSSGNEVMSYFSGFNSTYDKDSETETCGIDNWSEYENDSLRFDTFTEAKSWLDVINKDTYGYEYAITLKRFSNKSDTKERGENCGDMISLKTFYTTQEI